MVVVLVVVHCRHASKKKEKVRVKGEGKEVSVTLPHVRYVDGRHVEASARRTPNGISLSVPGLTQDGK
jgi:hypothetical protein